MDELKLILYLFGIRSFREAEIEAEVGEQKQLSVSWNAPMGKLSL